MSRKEFVINEDSGKEVKLAIRKPQYEDFEEADRVYAGTVARLVRGSVGKKLLLRQELDTFLREAKVWTQDDEKHVRTLQEEVDSLLKQVANGGRRVSEGRELCIKVMDKRKDIVRIMQKRQVFDDATIESNAENDKNDYIVYICTVYSDSGKNYWNSLEDMKNDKLSDAYRKASVAALEFIFNYNPEFEKRLPENRWLKKYGFIDDNLNYVDRKTGEKVDRFGKPVKEVEEDVQKRVDSLQGEIVEESPFLDDETNEPVVIVSEATKKTEAKEVEVAA